MSCEKREVPRFNISEIFIFGLPICSNALHLQPFYIYIYNFF